MTLPISFKTRITTQRLAQTRDWYCALLDLVVVEQWDEPGDAGCILALGDPPGEALLEIYAGASRSDSAGLSLQFRVDDVNAFHVPDEPRFRFDGPVERPWGSRYLYFSDPNGISVILFSGTSF